MTTIREASAVWDGNIQDGAGRIDLGAGAQGQFDRTTRFADGESHNPETLAAGALAGCYAMSLASRLAESGFTPVEIRNSARVVLEQDVNGYPFIPTVDINARAQVNNIDYDMFMKIAEAARAQCPMANLFAGAEVTLEAEIVGG